ncbi:hypothetical protein MK139_17755, partial [bacterium]|nr:hypothetical protein [bacterium]
QVSVYALGRVQTKWIDDRVNERITQLKPHAGIITVLFIYGIVILGTFREYGITNDEHLHINYGDAILDWFVTLGADDRAIHDDRTYPYGGFFDLIGAVPWIRARPSICRTPSSPSPGSSLPTGSVASLAASGPGCSPQLP